MLSPHRTATHIHICEYAPRLLCFAAEFSTRNIAARFLTKYFEIIENAAIATGGNDVNIYTCNHYT